MKPRKFTDFAPTDQGFSQIDSMLAQLDANTDVERMTTQFAKQFRFKPAYPAAKIDDEGQKLRR